MDSGVIQDKRLAWLKADHIRPYVFVRGTNAIDNPGRAPLDWFPQTPIVKEPQKMGEVEFTDQILRIENKVFGEKLAMPRWVFYDCAIMPGVTSGFAVHRDAAPDSLKSIAKPAPDSEWIPLSLFITIPTMRPGEWVAHNLSSINSVVPGADRLYGLGFLTKAFGLWYANIETCCGMTQWRSPALRLHSHYGDLEVITAYTPSHTIAQTLTYSLKVNIPEWDRFFTHSRPERFYRQYVPAGPKVQRAGDASLQALQRRLEEGEGPYFLDAAEIDARDVNSELTIFVPR
jgi:hypothetical protein